MKTFSFIPLTLLLSAAMLFAGTYSGGSGTDGDPYQIANLNDLIELSLTSGDWSSDFVQTAPIDASSTITLNSNGSGGYYGFSPIGNSVAKFTGTYNGQGYTIDGLYINRATDQIGLFGWINTASIENMGVTNINITGKTYVGGLIGVGLNSATVSNCHSTGTVTGTANYVGGLIGYSVCSVNKCYNACSVTGSSGYVGGLVGNNSQTVSECYNTGNVKGYQHVGGLVGYNTSTIINCYNTGSATRSDGSSNTSFGAFVGYNYGGVIESSYSIGSVYSSDGIAWNENDNNDKGFVGLQAVSNTYSNNFFDSQVSNQSSDTIGSATAKTTAEMKNIATFTSTATSGLTTAWDFVTNPNDDALYNDYWDMDISGNVNSGYPYLDWEDGEDVSLPVELASFTVEYINNGVVLNWETESELENLGFIIERRNLGNSEWKEIANYQSSKNLTGHGSTTERHVYRYIDYDVIAGRDYEYRLGDVDYSGKMTWNGRVRILIDDENELPLLQEFGISKTYPNPFNPRVTICYNVQENTLTILQVYDLRGCLVETLENEFKTAGQYNTIWQPINLSSGTYIVRLQSGNRTHLKRIVYMK